MSPLVRLRRALRALEVAGRHAAGRYQPEATLIDEAQRYWTDPSNRSLVQHSHWRGFGVFSDDRDWLRMGQDHLRLYQELARAADVVRPTRRIVEWGCGGGMNAVHFGCLAEEFWGIDINRASLEECRTQMSQAHLNNFSPILIDTARPEAALDQLPGPCDLLISTYVFELLPSPEYGVRLLDVLFQALATGGLAFIQIKYNDGSWNTVSRRWAYARNLAWNTTYGIEEFWSATIASSSVPKS